jgi:HEAT repeat protein
VNIALISLWIALGAVLFTTALTTSLRAFGALTAARCGRYRARVSEELAAYAVGARDEPPPPPSGRLEQRVLHEELARLAANLKGDAHQLLAGLFDAYGLVETVGRDLGSDHPLAAIRAAELAGIMHASECVPILRARLDSSDPLIRLACARALSEIGALDAMPRIVATLGADGDVSELGRVLMGFGAGAEPLLRLRLRGARRAQERRIAAVTLGEMHAHPAVADLIEALSDPDDEVQAAAARALGQIGEQSASGALVALLQRVDAGVGRVAAASALGMLDDPSAAPALVTALGAEDWDIRNAAARSLVALGEPGLAEVSAAVGTIPPRGVAHFAGLLDVANGLGPLIEAAAGGDAAMHRLTHAVCESGVRSRLRDLASGADGGSPSVGAYALAVLNDAAAPR